MRHFVKYSFLQVDPAWKRLDAAQRLADKEEFLAACDDFG
jgi:chlorite dismutase